MSALLRIASHAKDLGGGFVVRRCLPSVQRQSVGPFLFFDHFGPVTETPGRAHDVRPHPHIGLATVTYLFEGAMQHRDSLGSDQRIEPGALNLMIAGRGIVHSERKPLDLVDRHYPIHGLQLWAALPLAQETCEPSFSHTPAHAIPQAAGPGWTARVLMGTAWGLQSPVPTPGETLYLDVQLNAEAELALPASHAERAIYLVEGALHADGEALEAQTLYVLPEGHTPLLRSEPGARFAVIGGVPLDGGHRHLWWNFVASQPALIDQAKADWAAQRMGQVPGETEWIPLPVR